MAASIGHEGILQSLLVVPHDEHFYTVIGGRRLAGASLLHKRGALAADAPVPCIVAPDLSTADALAKSIAAEDSHVPPHPVDRYESFAVLQQRGLSIHDIAARYFLEPRIVRQSLALGDLHVDIRTAWRRGEIAPEVAQLFTLADDDSHQVKTLDKLREKFGDKLRDIGPDTVRKYFAGPEAEARRLLIFVGREKYLADGGRLTEDLFAGTDDAPSHVVHDPAKLKKLAQAQLDADASALKSDGWSWVDTQLTAADLSSGLAQRIVIEQPNYTAEERAEIKRIDKLTAQLDKRAAEAPADAIDTLAHERDELSRAKLKYFDAAALRTYTAAEKAKAGCVISIASDGTLSIDHGLIKPEAKDKPADAPKPDKKSDKLSAAALDAVRKVQSGALATALRANKHTALATVLASAGTSQAPLALFTGEPSGRAFGAAFNEYVTWKTDMLVGALIDIFARALDVKPCTADDISFLIESCDELKYSKAAAEAFDAKAYFAGCSKDYLLELIGEALGDDEVRERADKPQKTLAAFCVDSVAVHKGWLPPELRGPSYKLQRKARK